MLQCRRLSARWQRVCSDLPSGHLAPIHFTITPHFSGSGWQCLKGANRSPESSSLRSDYIHVIVFNAAVYIGFPYGWTVTIGTNVTGAKNCISSDAKCDPSSWNTTQGYLWSGVCGCWMTCKCALYSNICHFGVTNWCSVENTLWKCVLDSLCSERGFWD